MCVGTLDAGECWSLEGALQASLQPPSVGRSDRARRADHHDRLITRPDLGLGWRPAASARPSVSDAAIVFAHPWIAPNSRRSRKSGGMTRAILLRMNPASSATPRAAASSVIGP